MSVASELREAMTKTEAVSDELDVEGYRKERGPEWCAIFDTMRDYRLSNMTFEGTDEPFCLVDLVSTIGGDITTGEWELLMLADEISIALSRRAANSTGGVEVKALEWVGDEAETPFGKYRLYRTDDGYGLSFNDDELVHVGFNSVDPLTSPRAKAAGYAQPHYRAAILSAIASSPVSAEVTELTVDEVERIIIDTEPPSQSDHGDKVWTRRMAVALVDRLAALNGGRENG